MMWNWDHDACVNNPVSGDVWGDVLRNVAVWHMRTDVHAPRVERVCKKWKHYWQVAEGVFDVDVRANRLLGLVIWPPWKSWPMTMKDLKMYRERARLHQLASQFEIKGVGALARPPPRTYRETLAEQERRRRLQADRAEKDALERIRSQCERLLPPPPTVQLSDFLASSDGTM
jgi:hypothetical protein